MFLSHIFWVCLYTAACCSFPLPNSLLQGCLLGCTLRGAGGGKSRVRVPILGAPVHMWCRWSTKHLTLPSSFPWTGCCFQTNSDGGDDFKALSRGLDVLTRAVSITVRLHFSCASVAVLWVWVLRCSPGQAPCLPWLGMTLVIQVHSPLCKRFFPSLLWEHHHQQGGWAWVSLFFSPLQNTAAVLRSCICLCTSMYPIKDMILGGLWINCSWLPKCLKSGSLSAFGKSCPKCGLKADALGHVPAVFIPECSSIPGGCHAHTVGWWMSGVVLSGNGYWFLSRKRILWAWWKDDVCIWNWWWMYCCIDLGVVCFSESEMVKVNQTWRVGWGSVTVSQEVLQARVSTPLFCILIKLKGGALYCSKNLWLLVEAVE